MTTIIWCVVGVSIAPTIVVVVGSLGVFREGRELQRRQAIIDEDFLRRYPGRADLGQAVSHSLRLDVGGDGAGAGSRGDGGEVGGATNPTVKAEATTMAKGKGKGGCKVMGADRPTFAEWSATLDWAIKEGQLPAPGVDQGYELLLVGASPPDFVAGPFRLNCSGASADAFLVNICSSAVLD